MSQLVLTHRRRVIAINIADIFWIRADHNYVFIHCGNGVKRIRCTLKVVERRIGRSELVRLNRSTLVRIAAVDQIRTAPGKVLVQLCDSTILCCSRRLAPLVRSTLAADKLHSARLLA
jgi:two-component system LytT family response regulator